MPPCVLVKPDYPSERKGLYGIGPDPLVAAVRPAGLRQVAWLISAFTLLLLVGIASSLPDNPEPLPTPVSLPLAILFLAGIFAPTLVKDRIVNEQRVAFRRVDPPSGLDQTLESMRCDSVRFRDMAVSQPRTHRLANETAESLAWLLWHTADRVDRIALLQEELAAAGLHISGPAKEAWFYDRKRQVDDLREPILVAAEQVRALADLAEDTVWAARLATESFPTVEVAAPTAREIGAEGDIEAAVDALASWHAAWTLLDERLRALPAKMADDESSS